MRRFLALLVLALAACTSPASQPPTTAATASPTSVPTASATPTVTPKPTASPRAPAPAELQGRWRTVINEHDKPVLTLDDFHYTIERLGIGTGSTTVDGDQIVFYGSNLCQGEGTYRWSIDGETLTLSPVGPDPCENRADAIRNRPFSRMS
jgi:hypothetical protein